MLDKLAAEISEQLKKDHNDIGPSFVEQQISLYENATNLMKRTLSNVTELAKFEISFLKALEMYKSGELDGTRTTYICLGNVIEVTDIKNMPDYTIIDGPPAQQFHFRAAYGPRNEVGYHFVITLAK